MSTQEPAAYLRASWSAADGLPQNTVTDIVQTRDGYLWLATLGGLVRFDGVRFTVYTGATTPALGSNRIQALAEDRDGTLWIGAEVGGITTLRRDVVERFAGSDQLPAGSVQAFCMRRDGSVWVGTMAGLARIEGGRVTDYTARAALPHPSVQALVEDREGSLWIGTPGGLVYLTESSPPRLFTKADGLPSPVITALHYDQDGTLWAGTTGGPARFASGAFITDPSSGGRRPGVTKAFARDRDGALWIGAGPSGLFRLERGRLVHVADGTGIAENQTESLLVDREGTLWIGTDRAGLLRWRRRGVTVLGPAQGIGGLEMRAILEDRDGGVWIGSYCGGVTRFHDGRITTYAKKEGLAHTCVTALAEDRAGRVWIGTDGPALYSVENARLTAYGSAEGLSGASISAIHEDAAGRIWVGTPRGLHLFRDGRFTAHRTRNGLVHDDVTVIAAGRGGALWIGTLAGLSRLQDGRFTSFTTRDGLSHNVVRDIYEDADGVVWIGTYGGGLNRLERGRFTHYTVATGLFDDLVSRILIDDRDRFWMSGHLGIFRVSRQELNDFAAGRIPSISSVAYDAADGMISSETTGGTQPAGWRTRDGRLWFPTVAGVVVLDPRVLANDRPPPIAIEQVLVDQRAIAPGGAALRAGPGGAGVQTGAIELAAGARSLEIRYTALSLADPTKVRFRYALEGFDPGPVDVGTRRVAYYMNLPPGRYRFRVTATNNDGVWNADGAALPIVQHSHFYQTAWFGLLVALTLAGAGVGGYYLRVRRLMRRAHELEAHVADRTAQLVDQRNELARVNADLERANDDTRAVFDRLHAAVLMLDPNERITFLNHAAQQWLDTDPDTDIGRRWTDVLPLADDDRAKVVASWAAPAGRRSKVPVRVDVRGRRFWIEIETQDDPRDPERHILFLYDVTETCDLRRLLDERAQFQGLVGESRAVQLVLRQIRDVAPMETTVLVEGEAGTGKALVARAIHYLSPRKHRPFVAVTCAGLTDSLLASRIGAAGGGTIFLDEIGEIPRAVQTSLLRVLQEKEITWIGEPTPRHVDVQIIAATDRDLAQAVSARSFRPDLLKRMRVTRIPVPPLRERREDIPLLAAWFLGQARGTTGRRVADISRDAMEALLRYPWPGNVRELKSAIASAVSGCSGTMIMITDLPAEVVGATEASLAPDERQRIIDALGRTEGNRAAAARLLGIGRTKLYRRMKELAIDVREKVS